MKVNSEGVSASRVYLPADQSHLNLLAFFVAQFPHIAEVEWADRFDEGLILDKEGHALKAGDPYLPNTHLLYFRRLAREPNIPFEEKILYQDEHILVADKPHFLPVTPSGLYLHQTLLNRLKKKTGIQTLSPIHRIDRDTAGLVIFSVKPDERARYQNLFRDRAVKKVYEAIAPYSESLAKQLPMTYQSRIEESEHFLQMQEVQGDSNSNTFIEQLQIKGAWAKYRLPLEVVKSINYAATSMHSIFPLRMIRFIQFLPLIKNTTWIFQSHYSYWQKKSLLLTPLMEQKEPLKALKS